MAKEHGGPLATLFGTYYPTGYIVAIFKQEREAEQAAAALREAGWQGDDLRQFTGAFILANHEARVSKQNLIQKIGAALTSDEQQALDFYIHEARRGAHFLTVYAPTQEQTTRAHAILSRLGAYGMRHYGEMTIADLPSAAPPGITEKAEDAT